jgi:hypothetical protein
VDTDRLLHLVWDAEDDDTGKTAKILADYLEDNGYADLARLARDPKALADYLDEQGDSDGARWLRDGSHPYPMEHVHYRLMERAILPRPRGEGHYVPHCEAAAVRDRVRKALRKGVSPYPTEIFPDLSERAKACQECLRRDLMEDVTAAELSALDLPTVQLSVGISSQDEYRPCNEQLVEGLRTWLVRNFPMYPRIFAYREGDPDLPDGYDWFISTYDYDEEWAEVDDDDD